MLYPDQSTAIIFTICYIIFLFFAAILLAPVEPPLGMTVFDNEEEERREDQRN